MITRYYLRYGDANLPSDGSVPTATWVVVKHIRRTIFVGTPNAGSVKAMVQLVDGVTFAPIFPRVEAAMLRTFTSVYQLLPRGRPGALVDAAEGQSRIENLNDPQLWEQMGGGLALAGQEEVLEDLLPEVVNPVERRRV